MTKNQSLFFRFLLFVAGAGIVCLVFFLTTGNRELTRIDAFVWTSVGIMYLMFFLPFFFSVIKIGNFSVKIPGLVLFWLGIFLYILCSTVIILLLAPLRLLPFNAAIIIQSIVLFLFLINVFFAFFASSHIANTAAGESGKQQHLNRIKPKARILSLSVDKLSPEYARAQKILTQALDDIKYIYPADRGAGSELELQIIASLDFLSELCDNIQAGSHTTELLPEAEKLQRLVNERKLLRN
jgi:hypothetical protein